jgi:hypothetical protein
MLLAAASVAFVDDHAEDPVSAGAVLAGDRHEHLTTTETAHPSRAPASSTARKKSATAVRSGPS